MPEKRMGHIAEAQSQTTKSKLPVTFFLATNPAKQLQGEVETIELSAEVRGDSGNTVLVRVSFDQKKLHKVIANPKIGASATAKIHCGKRAIGYVWFHDLVDFIRAKICSVFSYQVQMLARWGVADRALARQVARTLRLKPALRR